MNKNIKRIVALALAVGTVSAVTPATNYNLLTTKAYASNNDADDVNSLTLEDHDGNSLKLYTDSGCTNVVSGDLDPGDTYYTTTVTTAASVKISNVSGPDDDKVRIFRGSDTDSNDDYEIGDSISLIDDTTTLKVRVYDEDYDEDEDYSSSDYNQYEIEVKYTGDNGNLDDEDNDEEDNDDDYLDSLELSDNNGNNIQLYENSEYSDELDSDDIDDDNEGDTYYAKTSSNIVRIETSGPDDDYVRVFKSTSDSTEAVETGDDISVSEDKTLIVRIYDEEPDDDIEYEDDEDVVGEYKIKLDYTGDVYSTSTTTQNSASTSTSSATTQNSASTSTSGAITQNSASTYTNGATTTSTASTASTVKKCNQWVQVNGYWQYNDVLGNTLKSQWHFDGNYGKWYYLGSNGIMATNHWVSSGGEWYYLGVNGDMSTDAWILTGDKYYYVSSDGAMVINATISGYKIGSDGAWIQ